MSSSFLKFPNPMFCRKNTYTESVKGDKSIMPTIRVGSNGGFRRLSQQ